MTEEIVSYGVLSLIPAILAVVLAFWTKNVIISLMASLFVGCLITAGWNPWNAMQVMFSDHLFVDMTGSSNAQTIIMMSFVGGFVALIEATGGAKAFAAAIANKVHRRSTAQTTAWLGGLAIFFSDSGNSLILGPIFRPIFDRLRISRAKLAYILDSTSSPVCILVPITGWGVYIMGIIATEFENLGIQTSDASAFVQAIPYQFYALLALVLVPLIALSKRDFGPMAKFETYVLENGPTAAELEADQVHRPVRERQQGHGVGDDHPPAGDVRHHFRHVHRLGLPRPEYPRLQDPYCTDLWLYAGDHRACHHGHRQEDHDLH